jgi:hypothetical protein
VTVEGDRAISRAYVQARHLAPGAATSGLNGFVDTNGDYVDQWRRIAGRWLITRRDCSWQMIVGDPSIIFG